MKIKEDTLGIRYTVGMTEAHSSCRRGNVLTLKLFAAHDSSDAVGSDRLCKASLRSHYERVGCEMLAWVDKQRR